MENQDYYNNGNNGWGNPQFVKFSPKAKDEDLIKTVNTWVRESVTWHDAMLQYQNRSVRYYLGDQTDRAEVPPYLSNTVYNRIFEATETVIPIITGTAHTFIAVPGQDDERSLSRAQKVSKVLQRKYEDLEMVKKLENISRDMILKRFGVAKWFWNVTTDDIDVKSIDPRLILIPKLRMDANDPDFPYVIEIQEYTREEIEEYFPGVDIKKLTFGRRTEIATNPTPMNQWNAPVYQILETTTSEYKTWTQMDTVLKKMPNPYWDFEGEEVEVKETKENGKVKARKYKQYYNHLAYPTKEYVFFNPFVTGDSPVAETCLAEITIPIQDEINVQKRQIINNLIRMGNGQVYIDQEAIPKELEDQITSEPGLIITGKNLVSENRIKREPGLPLPEAHFNNLIQSIQAFDNVFGTHGATRGAQQGGTLGGQILNKQQDLSRIEQLTRVLNRGVARIADGLVQMMRMYYDTDHLIKILGKDGAIEFVHFTQNDIDPNTVIKVKSGTPPVLDPIGKYNQAIQLWQLNGIDPESFFERLDFADPQDMAKKLAAWKQGQLLLESQIKRDEAATIAASTAAVSGAGGGGGKPAAPVSHPAAPGNTSGTSVESPINVIDRARAAISAHGKSPITNPPKVKA